MEIIPSEPVQAAWMSTPAFIPQHFLYVPHEVLFKLSFQTVVGNIIVRILALPVRPGPSHTLDHLHSTSVSQFVKCLPASS